jgi:hypothetical protein
MFARVKKLLHLFSHFEEDLICFWLKRRIYLGCDLSSTCHVLTSESTAAYGTRLALLRLSLTSMTTTTTTTMRWRITTGRSYCLTTTTTTIIRKHDFTKSGTLKGRVCSIGLWLLKNVDWFVVAEKCLLCCFGKP